jgi:hypothetical protein
MGKRKRLRNKQRAKERSTAIVLDMGHPVALTRAAFADGGLRVFAADGPASPECAWIETTYPRAKGLKVLNRANIDPKTLVVHPNDVLAQYLWTFAVDTNRPSDEAVTFTGVVQAQVASLGPTTHRVGIAREVVIELHNIEFPAERFGWWLVTSSVVNRAVGVRTAVLVDSDLSKLPAINRREEPIVGNNYLPDGFELLYASSDAGGEFIANHLLQRADRNAREIAELYRSDDVAKPPVVATSEGGSLSYIRVWERHGPVA